MEIKNTKRIKVLENGPYEVTGGIPLNQLRFVPDRQGVSMAYEEGCRFLLQEKYNLCRCGRSKSKPFCDGTHLEGFYGKETATHQTYDQMAGFIEGKHINLLDAESLCAVARFCDTNGTTWNLVEESETAETNEIVVRQCCDCPSGRLTAVTKDGKAIEPELPQEVSILEDPAAEVRGPIWVKGGISVEGADGRPYPVRNRMTLCRCGKSKNKPFCDGRHMQNQGEILE
ncbi:CDGSH-type Zn-finger protein [Dysgonomonas hofstadii]|uniref:CDGSH-type Zn-finger protein n=1 Tax=Dysgonomonas hofstadii TaxID=637886 RepID=A0A840CYN5_9BACT|nr:CDGSH iron-sulfur domain-containing protein [Dysgonomonas hofstadii]MBB4037053.1 CDGSH-type Zn-finger protein [Dysgonomonas hofstadii]